MIEIANLSKSYNKGTVKAVDTLNLTVNNGEIFSFLGPNGAGKTITIKMNVLFAMLAGGVIYALIFMAGCFTGNWCAAIPVHD